MDIERCEFWVNVGLPGGKNEDDVELFLTPGDKFLNPLFPIRPVYGARRTLDGFQNAIHIEQENIRCHVLLRLYFCFPLSSRGDGVRMADAGRGFSLPRLHMNETVKGPLSSEFNILTALLSEV